MNVQFLTRDINGNPIARTLRWCQVCDFIAKHKEELDDIEEILLIRAEATCIYSQLANVPITWDDVSGFFA